MVSNKDLFLTCTYVNFLAFGRFRLVSSEIGSRLHIGLRSTTHSINSSETSKLSGQALFIEMAEDIESKTKCKECFKPLLLSCPLTSHLPNQVS